MRKLFIFLIGLLLVVISVFVTLAPAFFIGSTMMPCAKEISNSTALTTLGIQLLSILLINLLYSKVGKFTDKDFRRYITTTFPQILIAIIMLFYIFTLIQQYNYLRNCENNRQLIQISFIKTNLQTKMI